MNTTTNPRIYSMTAAIVTIFAMIYAAFTYLPNIDLALLIVGALIATGCVWVIVASINQSDVRELLLLVSATTTLFAVYWLWAYYPQNTSFFVAVKLLVIVVNLTALNALFMFPASAWNRSIVASPNYRRSYTGPISA